MKTMTFNLRCVYCDDVDGINSFVHRAGMIFDMLQREQADVVGFQELTPKILSFLTHALSHLYTFYHAFRTENFDGEGVAIAIRKDVFDVFGEDVYWISPTPTVPGSRFPKQSRCPRIALALKLRERETGRFYYVTNIHLDHKDEESRVLGIGVVLEKIHSAEVMEGTQYLLMGDFNDFPASETIKRVCDFGLSELTAPLTHTFHAFGRRDEHKIDYIFASSTLKCISAYPVIDCYNGIYLSDHYPLVCVTE